MSAKSTISDILRSEFSQIDDNIYQYIEGDYIMSVMLFFEERIIGVVSALVVNEPTG